MEELLDEKLYDLLACPVCKGELSYNTNKTGLDCSKCSHTYKIEFGVARLLPPE